MNLGVIGADALWGLSYVTEEGREIADSISKSVILENVIANAQPT